MLSSSTSIWDYVVLILLVIFLALIYVSTVQFNRTAVFKQTVLENDNDNVFEAKQVVLENGIGSVSALPKQAVPENDIG